jgi:hypothetical protein
MALHHPNWVLTAALAKIPTAAVIRCLSRQMVRVSAWKSLQPSKVAGANGDDDGVGSAVQVKATHRISRRLKQS